GSSTRALSGERDEMRGACIERPAEHAERLRPPLDCRQVVGTALEFSLKVGERRSGQVFAQLGDAEIVMEELRRRNDAERRAQLGVGQRKLGLPGVQLSEGDVVPGILIVGSLAKLIVMLGGSLVPRTLGDVTRAVVHA